MATNDYSKGLVNYTDRDYSSLVEKFWQVVPTLTELWKPEADSDPGVVLGKWLASVADMLGVNTDWVATEIFAPTVSQRKDAEKVFGLIGYDLGWFTAAKTEVTFTNNSPNDITLDFGFNGSNFATLNAYTDITNQSRVITYNILPMTSAYGDKDTRSKRQILTENVDVFADTDKVTLAPGGSTTRVAVEGELRSYSVTVEDIKRHNYKITLPSQHIDTTAIWVKARSADTGAYLSTQWIQCSSPAEFVQPEPRFAVTYDNYSNAQVQISNYLNQLEDYDGNSLVIYWIDCSGVIGCVGENVLQNFLQAKPDNNADAEAAGDIIISNLSNTVELPHTNTVTGKSPETAKEAYANSRKFINTNNSLITLPDFSRFLTREPGVDCGTVLDCQKALEINMAIYNDGNLTETQKAKQYISKYDYPVGNANIDWTNALGLGFDPSDPNKFVFTTNFKQYTAMCYAIHNDFNNSAFGNNQVSFAQINNVNKFIRYKPPVQFIQNVIRDYRPLQAMSVELDFGYIRVFNFHVVGTIYPKVSVSQDVANNIIQKVKEALAMYYAPANRSLGLKPNLMEIVKIIESADSRIAYFDAGGNSSEVISWDDCDVDYFNPISFARYIQPAGIGLIVAPNYIVD